MVLGEGDAHVAGGRGRRRCGEEFDLSVSNDFTLLAFLLHVLLALTSRKVLNGDCSQTSSTNKTTVGATLTVWYEAGRVGISPRSPGSTLITSTSINYDGPISDSE